MEHYGFLSLLPPIIAVLLAVRYRNVIVALFSGVLIGTLVLANWNPIAALSMTIKDYIFKQASGGYNSSLLVM
jgi:Na+/H+ antiporter NhaC